MNLQVANLKNRNLACKKTEILKSKIRKIFEQPSLQGQNMNFCGERGSETRFFGTRMICSLVPILPLEFEVVKG